MGIKQFCNNILSTWDGSPSRSSVGWQGTTCSNTSMQHSVEKLQTRIHSTTKKLPHVILSLKAWNEENLPLNYESNRHCISYLYARLLQGLVALESVQHKQTWMVNLFACLLLRCPLHAAKDLASLRIAGHVLESGSIAPVAVSCKKSNSTRLWVTCA